VATMREVAQHAGVSISTVSHVLNGTRFVSEDLEVRVRGAIEELCYQPDRRAQSLRRGRSETIAVIVSDIGNTFFASLFRGIEDRLMDAGYRVLLTNTGEDASAEVRSIAMMQEQRVEGFIVAPTSKGDTNLRALVDLDVPLVVVDRPVDLPVDQVFSDNEQGSYDAVTHLIDLGHRCIGTIVELEGIRTFDDRLRGWRRALEDHGIEIEERWIAQAGLEIEGAAAAMGRLRSRAPEMSAIFSSNNIMTLGVLRSLREGGQRYPHDLSIVGFDDPPWASSIYPGLTSVAQSPFEIGDKAAELLIRRLDGSDHAPEQVCLDCELILRESSIEFQK